MPAYFFTEIHLFFPRPMSTTHVYKRLTTQRDVPPGKVPEMASWIYV